MSARKFVATDDVRAALRAGRSPGPISRLSAAHPRAYDDGTRRIRFCFSDGSVDRMGDTIDPRGWDLNAFARNPVALWAHDSSQPPIGRASNLGVEGNRLMGDIEFAAPETYEFADQIYRLACAGFVSSVSVGFLPIDFAFSDDPARRGGIDFKRQELLEISVVPVPANANALVGERGMSRGASGARTVGPVATDECTDADVVDAIRMAELRRRLAPHPALVEADVLMRTLRW